MQCLKGIALHAADRLGAIKQKKGERRVLMLFVRSQSLVNASLAKAKSKPPRRLAHLRLATDMQPMDAMASSLPSTLDDARSSHLGARDFHNCGRRRLPVACEATDSIVFAFCCMICV